jgi:protein SCO1
MNRKDLVYSIVGLVLAGIFLPVNAQGPAPGEVGIYEKLGSTVALDTFLHDEQGNDVTLRQLMDQPTILTLNYFRCTGICTPLLNGLVSALGQIKLEPGRDFEVITVSFDPRDTPEIAHEKKINYLAEMRRAFPPKAWRFLTGKAQNTKAIADSVGFVFRAEGDQYIHPGAIMVLTPKGVVSRYLYGTSFVPAELQMAIQDAAGGQVRPSVSRALAFCYSYDPRSRAYVFSITRLVGALTLALAGVFLFYLVLKARARRKHSLR